jgi:hypothetical protein
MTLLDAPNEPLFRGKKALKRLPKRDKKARFPKLQTAPRASGSKAFATSLS